MKKRKTPNGQWYYLKSNAGETIFRNALPKLSMKEYREACKRSKERNK